MATVSEKIESIVAQRAEHLPKIQEKRNNLLEIQKRLNSLEALISVINKELNDGQGTYYTMLSENDKMRNAFNRVNTASVRSLIRKQLENLDLLEKRFSRKTVCIAMIGYERQGKSTFLQAISGLENDVIPAYSGTSCTGAVSVIHNIDGPFRTEVEMYSIEEFLSIVREKLKNYFPDRNFVVNSPADLPNLDLSGFIPYGPKPVLLTTEFNKFKEAYCNHVDVYAELLGCGKMTFTDPKMVIQHVAQYQEFAEQPEGDDWYMEDKNDGSVVYKRNYYKYIAVKNVNIYKEFALTDCKQLQLVDTIGMGDASNAAKIEEEMFRVLREDCDAAVNLFKPDALGGGFTQQQADILQKISDQLGHRDPSKWIVYVINKVVSGVGKNVANISSVIQQIQNVLNTLQDKPVSWIKSIQGNSVDDVRDNLVNPLLDLITENLPDLDKGLMTEANKCAEDLYTEYYKLSSAVDAVLSNGSHENPSIGKLFDELYRKQTDCLFRSLRILDEDYGSNRQKPCKEISDTLGNVIKKLYNVVPRKAEIEPLVDVGVHTLSEIYNKKCNQLCNNIYELFEKVSLDVINPLREQVKEHIVKLLFETGAMGRLPLKNYNISGGVSLEWMKCFIEEKVSADKYPNLRKTLEYVLDYKFSIEDTIEYDVSKCVDVIDTMNDGKFMPFSGFEGGRVDEKTQAVWQELNDRIPLIQKKMLAFTNEFSLIPSYSFATRVQKFRIKITRDDNVVKDLTEFYRDNCYAFWREDFNKIEEVSVAFGKWNDECRKLSEFCSKDKFELV